MEKLKFPLWPYKMREMGSGYFKNEFFWGIKKNISQLYELTQKFSKLRSIVWLKMLQILPRQMISYTQPGSRK